MVTKVKDMSPKQRRGFFASLRRGQESIRQAGVRFREAREAKLERQILREQQREKVLEERLSRRQRLEEARTSRIESVQSRRQKLAELKAREREARREIFRLSPAGRAVRTAKAVGIKAIQAERAIEKRIKKSQARARKRTRTVTRTRTITRKPRRKREETFSDFLG